MAKSEFSKGVRVRPTGHGAVLFAGKKVGVCINLRPDKAGCMKVQWDAPEGGCNIVHIDFIEVIE